MLLLLVGCCGCGCCRRRCRCCCCRCRMVARRLRTRGFVPPPRVSSSVPCEPRPHSAMADLVATGLEPTELVLRGGELKGPLVVHGIILVDGVQFFELRKTDKVLMNFLSRRAAFHRPLAKCGVFGKMVDGRNGKYRELLAAILNAEPEGEGGEPTKDDQAVDDLDLDGSDGEPGCKNPNVVRGSRKKGRAARKLLPRSASVTFQRPGRTDWTVVLAMTGPQKAVAMEATTANFKALYEWVQDDLAESGEPDQGKPVEEKPRPARPVPRPRRVHADGSREYNVGGKWVRKFHQPDKRYKTLVRRTSDESTRGKTKAGAAKRSRVRTTARASRPAAAAPVAGAVDDDDLEL